MYNKKHISVALPEHEAFKIKERAYYHDITMQEILICALEMFMDGELDERLGFITEDK